MKKDAIISYLDRGRAKIETIHEQYGVSCEDILRIDWGSYRNKWYNEDNSFAKFLIWGEIKKKLREYPLFRNPK